MKQLLCDDSKTISYLKKKYVKEAAALVLTSG
jgi:hypothetical protein